MTVTAFLSSGRRRSYGADAPPAGLPSWVPDVGEWVQVTGTTLSSVDPSPTPAGATGPQSKISAWNGFACDPRTSKVYCVAAGGHNDYAGNECDVLDLNTESPGWSQVIAPTSSGNVVDGVSYYADGKPTSRHHFYGLAFSEQADRVMMFGGSHWSSVGGFHSAVTGYIITSNTYDTSGVHDNLTSNSAADVATCCADPTTGDVYIFCNFAVAKWDAGDFSLTEIFAPGSAPAGQNGPTACDHTRGRIFLVGGQYTHRHLYSISGNTFSQPTLSGAASSAVQNCEAGSAMVYIEAEDAYFLRTPSSGGTVYRIDASTFACTSFSTTGGTSIPTVANNDGSNPNGPYGKFVYVPDLKGCWFTPRHNANGWFLRIHA